VAFASLALAPIPPVQVFGLFVAVGVFIAWLTTMIFVPAFVVALGETSLNRIASGNTTSSERVLAWCVRGMGQLATRRTYLLLGLFVVVVGAPVPGLTHIQINDNPVCWFKSGSEIRVAIEELNETFPGVYNANLIVEATGLEDLTDPLIAASAPGLQQTLERNSVVGDTTSYMDMAGPVPDSGDIKRDQMAIKRELDSAAESPNGHLLGGLITSEYRNANIQLLMKEGDNQAMHELVDLTEAHLADNPLPAGFDIAWGGETYLDLVWQDKMVSGMFKAFLSTFGVALVLVILLFRSLRWGLLAMVPMSVSIVLVYGTMGFMGRNYDMPLAVLSTLVLGISIDFAIHFLQRCREQMKVAVMNSIEAIERIFEKPGRAIARNALIVALGFVLMFFSSLGPYLVVGTLMASIMVISFLTSLLLLPAVISFFTKGNPGRGST